MSHTQTHIWEAVDYFIFMGPDISPTDVGSLCDKFKPSDNRLHIFWLLTLYQWDLMGFRLKAADLNINQINSAEGFVIL